MAVTYFARKRRLSPLNKLLLRLAVLVVLALLAHWGVKLQPPAHEATARIIDGDTLDLAGKRVRLFGLDAPETKQSCARASEAYACGLEAKQALEALIGASPVRCEDRDIDRYGRLVAICYVRDIELNDWLVRQGYAFAYKNYSDRYSPAEEEARANKRGVWQGSFEYPWDFRRKK